MLEYKIIINKLINYLNISYQYLNKKNIKKKKLLINYLINNLLLLNNLIFLNNLYLKKLLFNNNKLNYFEIEKGLKKKKLGIYLRNFSKEFFYFQNSQKYCYLIIRFVRKNLFLTLLNKKGNVLCKTNIGSCGFKKKVKFTGYAIKRTSKKFGKKILKLFIKTIYLIHKNFKKIKKKVNKKNNIKIKFNFFKRLSLLKKSKKNKKLKYNKLKYNKKLKNKKLKYNKKLKKNKFKYNKKLKKNKQEKLINKILKYKINQFHKNDIWEKILKKRKSKLSKEDNEKRRLKELLKLKEKKKNLNLFLNKNKNLKIKNLNKKLKYLNYNLNNQIILLKKGNLLNFIKNKKLNYRNYLYYQNKISKNLNIKIRIKSSLKFWGFKFLMYGLGKKFYWFKGLEVKLPIPHSEGLRLKKKRRV